MKSDAQVQKNEQSAPGPYYTSWLNEDVVWIISDQERAAFDLLQNDEERDRFIDAFWMHRNPHPDQLGNIFEDEHYRRMQYANEHFKETSLPGWQTERGRTYIRNGAPDTIRSLPTSTERPFQKEVWEYHYVEGIGANLKILFEDGCMCGIYRLVTQGAETATKAQKTLAFTTIKSPPQTKYKGLEEVLTHKNVVWSSHNYSPLSLEVTQTNSKVTHATCLTTIEIKVQQSQPQTSGEETTPIKKLILFGQITSIGGRIVRGFDDSLDIDDESSVEVNAGPPTLKEIFPLRPGKYRLSIAVQDVPSEKVGTWDRGMIVPE